MKSISKFFLFVSLFIWISVGLYFGSYWMSHHHVAYEPDGHAVPVNLQEHVQKFFSSSKDQPSWKMIHWLSADCNCSRDTLEYLLRPQRLAELSQVAEEYVVWRGSKEELGFDESVLDQRFNLKIIKAAQFPTIAVPTLMIIDDQGRTRYVGGYKTRSQSLEYLDVNILRSLQSGRGVASLPVYGCVTEKNFESIWSYVRQSK